MTNDLDLSLAFADAHTLDAARILERQPVEEIIRFLQEVPAGVAARLMKSMDTLSAQKCFVLMSPGQSAAILAELPFEIATVFLRPMQESVQQAILKELAPETAGPIQLILKYPKGSAGALMDPQVFTVPEDITVKEALRRVQERPQQVIYYIYVVNREHALVGLINIPELLLLDPKTVVSLVMHTDFGRLSAHSNRRAILAHPGWREFHALPVVDEGGIFLGAVGYQTVRRLEEDRVDPAMTTGTALGELYWLGLSGLIKGAASAVSDDQE